MQPKATQCLPPNLKNQPTPKKATHPTADSQRCCCCNCALHTRCINQTKQNTQSQIANAKAKQRKRPKPQPFQRPNPKKMMIIIIMMITKPPAYPCYLLTLNAKSYHAPHPGTKEDPTTTFPHQLQQSEQTLFLASKNRPPRLLMREEVEEGSNVPPHPFFYQTKNKTQHAVPHAHP